MKNYSYFTGLAIGIILTLYPIKAESQVTSPSSSTGKLPTIVAEFNPAKWPIDIQNKKIADKKEAERKAEEARVAAIEAARLAEQQRLAQVAAQKAKEAQKAPRAAVSSVTPPTITVAGCGDNSYANFIYMKESGCRLNATNAGGCYGIGQACPGAKLEAACPNWQTDYACQNRFFTAYAGRYGGWAGAYATWLSQHWW